MTEDIAKQIASMAMDCTLMAVKSTAMVSISQDIRLSNGKQFVIPNMSKDPRESLEAARQWLDYCEKEDRSCPPEEIDHLERAKSLNILSLRLLDLIQIGTIAEEQPVPDHDDEAEPIISHVTLTPRSGIPNPLKFKDIDYLARGEQIGYDEYEVHLTLKGHEPIKMTGFSDQEATDLLEEYGKWRMTQT